jgi:hypothetical protein
MKRFVYTHSERRVLQYRVEWFKTGWHDDEINSRERDVGVVSSPHYSKETVL